MSANDVLRSEAMTVSVEGLKEAQAELQRLTMEASAQGGLRGRLNRALLQLQRYAIGIAHVITGRLKNSIFVEIEQGWNDLIGHVATNVAYSWVEDTRGGEHAFFGRTVREEGPRVNDLLKEGWER